MTSPGPVVGDTVGAFVLGPVLMARGSNRGPLRGRTFAAKDLLDVAGHRTGAGSPEWLADAEMARRTAPAVARLVEAGADLMGKTVSDELAYSINGTNIHYGTPRNPIAPERIPGGSSSGSAAAVAAGLVDFAVGTDTGGSIRVPASYCGLYGFRPTWGRVPVAGMVPLAPSFDTIGILAPDAATLRLAATVLLGGEIADGAQAGAASWSPPPTGILVATDAWAQLDASVRNDVEAELGLVLEAQGRAIESVELAGGEGGLDGWAEAFRVLQGREAWTVHGEWLSRRRPRLGPDIAGRFEAAASVTDDQIEPARRVRAQARARLVELLDGGRVLALPCAGGPAPTLEAARTTPLTELRARTFRLNSGPGLAGAPVVVIPLARPGGLPVGLALVGAPGDDERLLDLAVALLPSP